jgi:UDP-N-acetylmuramoyl-L-alanyl-D-glutamate--2,6-diaminopimelate ligase
MKLTINNVTITDDSRICDGNTVFLSDSLSSKYINEAQLKAKSVITASELKNYFDFSSISIIGITGTNGKTTTAALLYSLLLDLGYKVALQGTRGFFMNDEKIEDKSLTTPMLLNNYEHIQKSIENNCQFFIMEVSSHAIVQKRVEGINFSLKIHTNITSDHLDYHKTLEEYIAVKNSFFSDESSKIINKDDKNIEFNFKNTLTYAIDGGGHLRVEAYTPEDGLSGVVNYLGERAAFYSHLVGVFNLYNILAAIGAVIKLTNTPLEKICDEISAFAGVSGRMELVNSNPEIVVDFAHTADGIKNACGAVTHKKVVALFGAGGDRDKTKRPQMGHEASMIAHKIYLTSDNPRSEDPKSIIDDIYEGIALKEKVEIIVDRKKAIETAIDNLNEDEVLLVLGKGDENFQQIGDIMSPFNDKEIILNFIKTEESK